MAIIDKRKTKSKFLSKDKNNIYNKIEPAILFFFIGNKIIIKTD